MSKLKLLLVYLIIFLIFVSLSYFLVRFLSKTRSGPELKQNQATLTQKAASPPPNYKPPTILARLDFPKITPGSPIPQKVNKPFKSEQMFNTIDDAGNYFLFGVYKTASGKMLVAGIIQRIETTNGLDFWLVDEFGDPIKTVVHLSLRGGKFLTVETRNNPKALDLREKLIKTEREINSIKTSLVGARVVVEVNPDQDVINCLASSCSKPNLLLNGTILYL